MFAECLLRIELSLHGCAGLTGRICMLMGALGCTQVVWVLTALIGGISERNTGKHYAFRFISHNDGVNIKPNHVLPWTVWAMVM